MSTSSKLSIPEFDAMIERGAFVGRKNKIELLRGDLVEMNPAGPVHDDYISFLNRWSMEATRIKPIQVRIQCGLNLEELDSRPEPDVAWVNDRRYLDRHPDGTDALLVIEVSDSSNHHDLGEKSLLYAQASIIEYWVVNIQLRMVIVHRNPTNTGYHSIASHGIEDHISPLCLPNASMSLRSLFATDPEGSG